MANNMSELTKFICGLVWAAQPGEFPAAYWHTVGRDDLAAASHALAYANKGDEDIAWYFNAPRVVVR